MSEQRFFPGEPDLPSRIVMIGADGNLSLDAIAWLEDQGVPLVLLDWQGHVLAVIASSGWACDPTLRAAQLWAQQSDFGLKLATGLIVKKLVGTTAVLDSIPQSDERDVAIVSIGQILDQLRSRRSPGPTALGSLLMLEAEAARMYFRSWRALPLKWVGTNARPIPPAWRKIGSRSSTADGNPRARHPVNAMLNFAYGVLEGQVRVRVQVAGLDPSLAYLHASRPGGYGMVYDLMEPLRPKVELGLIDFLMRKALSPQDVVMSSNGVVRLRPELARVIVALKVGEDEVEAVVDGVAQELNSGR